MAHEISEMRSTEMPTTRAAVASWLTARIAVPPTGTVTPGAFTGTSLTVAFTAAVLGGMTSLPGAYVGGLALGLIESFTNKDASFVPLLNQVQNGQAELMVFVVRLVVLMFRPRGLLGEEA